jgi:hypothetical protein
MTISPHDILALAKDLQTSAKNEAEIRSAVSRAYYAAMLLTRDTIEDRRSLNNFSDNQDSTHKKIEAIAHTWGVGPNPGRGAASRIAKLLPSMKRLRVRSDYWLDDTITQRECDDLVAQVDVVMSSCAEITKKIAEAALVTEHAAPLESAVANVSKEALPVQVSKPTLTRIK